MVDEGEFVSICASGASRAKSTSAASIVVDAAYVQSLLPPGLAWLYPYLPYMHGLEIGNVGTFCTSDPPTWTVPTAADIFNFLAGGPISQYQLVDKFIQDVTKAYLWHQLCECTSGATPAAPAAPAAPVNLPSVNPPSVVALPNSGPCQTVTMSTNNVASAGDYDYAVFSAPLPSNASGVRLRYTTGVMDASTCISAIMVKNPFGNSDFFGGAASVCGPGVGGRDTFNVLPTGTTALKVRNHMAGNAAPVQVDYIIDLYCDGNTPTKIVTPCCPPDPVLMARVNQILDLVTLVQRQAVPFGYVPGAVHAGLTGSGSFSVSGLIGCKVDMTAIPPSYGVEFGTPDEHFDLGFVTFGSPDGYPSSKRLDHQPTLLLPARCGAYTTQAYDLAPGVVATITELAREV